MDKRRLAKSVTMNLKTGEVVIDGEPLGLYVASEDVEVTAMEGGLCSVVRIPLLAESVAILPREGADDGA